MEFKIKFKYNKSYFFVFLTFVKGNVYWLDQSNIKSVEMTIYFELFPVLFSSVSLSSFIVSRRS